MTDPAARAPRRVRYAETGARRAAPVALIVLLALSACQPTVRVEAPKDPITINLNIQADIRVKIEEQAKEDIKSHQEIF